MVQILLGHSVDLCVVGPDNAGPIAWAARNGDCWYKIVKILVDATDDPDETWNPSTTALHEAVRANAPKIVGLLLRSSKTDPNKEAEDYVDWPLGLACEYGSLNIVRSLGKDDRTDINMDLAGQRDVHIERAINGQTGPSLCTCLRRAACAMSTGTFCFALPATLNRTSWRGNCVGRRP